MTLLLSSKGPEADILSMCFGLYTQTGTNSGSPVYQQLHTVTSEDGHLLHYSHNRNGWIVREFGDDNAENIYICISCGDASVVPTCSNLKVHYGCSSKRTMSATPFNLTKDTCSSIKISAKGRAAKRCRDYMGTFTPVPGKYSHGRQVFRSSSGKYLHVNADFVRCDHDGDPDRHCCWVLHLLYALTLYYNNQNSDGS